MNDDRQMGTLQLLGKIADEATGMDAVEALSALLLETNNRLRVAIEERRRGLEELRGLVRERIRELGGTDG